MPSPDDRLELAVNSFGSLSFATMRKALEDHEDILLGEITEVSSAEDKLNIRASPIQAFEENGRQVIEVRVSLCDDGITRFKRYIYFRSDDSKEIGTDVIVDSIRA